MVDTLKLYLPAGKIDEDFESWFQRLQGVLSGCRLAGLYCGGHLGNMRVSAGPNGVKIEGSLAKYHLGNNLANLGRAGCKQALQSMGNALGLPIDQAEVRAVHVGYMMQMVEPVHHYLQGLLSMPHRDKAVYNPPAGTMQTVSFISAGKTLCCYDKAAEYRKSEKKELPPLYQGKHLLRIEARLLRAPGKALSYAGKLMAADLWQESVYMKLHQHWLQQWPKVQKATPPPTLDFATMPLTEKTITNAYQQFGASHLQAAMLQAIAQQRAAGQITAKKASKLKAIARGPAMATKTQAAPYGLMAELDEKVKAQNKHMR